MDKQNEGQLANGKQIQSLWGAALYAQIERSRPAGKKPIIFNRSLRD